MSLAIRFATELPFIVWALIVQQLRTQCFSKFKWFVGRFATFTAWWGPGEGPSPESLGLGLHNLTQRNFKCSVPQHYSFLLNRRPFLYFWQPQRVMSEWVTDRRVNWKWLSHYSLLSSTSLSSSSRSSRFPIIDLDTQAFVMSNSVILAATADYWNQLEVGNCTDMSKKSKDRLRGPAL